MENEKNNKEAELASNDLLAKVNDCIGCIDSSIGDAEPSDLGDYIDYPEELRIEYPMIYVMHRLLEMKGKLESS